MFVVIALSELIWGDKTDIADVCLFPVIFVVCFVPNWKVNEIKVVTRQFL